MFIAKDPRQSIWALFCTDFEYKTLSRSAGGKRKMKRIFGVISLLVALGLIAACAAPLMPMGSVQVVVPQIGATPNTSVLLPKQPPPITKKMETTEVCAIWAARIAREFPEGGISILDIIQNRVSPEILQIVINLSGVLCNEWYDVSVRDGKIIVKEK